LDEAGSVRSVAAFPSNLVAMTPESPPPSSRTHSETELHDAVHEPEVEQNDQPLDPRRLLRIAGVTREVLEEARRIRPEPGAVEHLTRVHEQIRGELRNALPRELYTELDDLTPEIRSGTLEELALAHAEVLGWLEGLFQGTQLALRLEAARALQRQVHRPGLPEPQPEHADSRYL
jgi:proteasome activator-like protein